MLRQALPAILTATLLLSSAHLRNFFAPKLVANRLHDSRRPGPSRRLLNREPRAEVVVRATESRPAPTAEREPVVTVESILPEQVRVERSKPAYLQPYRDPHRQSSLPS